MVVEECERRVRGLRFRHVDQPRERWNLVAQRDAAKLVDWRAVLLG